MWLSRPIIIKSAQSILEIVELIRIFTEIVNSFDTPTKASKVPLTNCGYII